MKLLRWAFLAVPIVGLAELTAHFVFATRPPSFDDWAGVVDAVRAMKREGDLVVISPAWADPAARRALGDELMPLRDVARPDVTRYAHALEVSVLGTRSDEIRSFREIEQRDVGRFHLRRVENPAPARVAYDFTDHLDPANADVRGTDPPSTCTWNPRANVVAGGLGGHPTFPPQRFECPAGVYFNVGVTVIADEEFRPRRCLWSHPFARGEIVTRFRDVPLGNVIRGHGGLYWIIEREKRGAPITLTVRVNGDTIGSFVHRDGDGWAPFEMALGKHAGARGATVEFAVASPNYRERHFCFEADSR